MNDNKIDWDLVCLIVSEFHTCDFIWEPAISDTPTLDTPKPHIAVPSSYYYASVRQMRGWLAVDILLRNVLGDSELSMALRAPILEIPNHCYEYMNSFRCRLYDLANCIGDLDRLDEPYFPTGERPRKDQYLFFVLSAI